MLLLLSEFYAIEGILIGLLGTYFLIRSFLYRNRVFSTTDKIAKKWHNLLERYKNADKKLFEAEDKYNKKFGKNLDSEQFELLFAVSDHTTTAIDFFNFRDNTMRKLNERFEGLVKRDAIKGFIIIIVGASLQIVSYLIDV